MPPSRYGKITRNSKKNEDKAFDTILSGKIPKYDRYIAKAAKASDLVDMGLEFLENAREFFSSLKITKVRLLSEEEAKKRKYPVLHLDSVDPLL